MSAITDRLSRVWASVAAMNENFLQPVVLHRQITQNQCRAQLPSHESSQFHDQFKASGVIRMGKKRARCMLNPDKVLRLLFLA
jgi:hypothetical protein